MIPDFEFKERARQFRVPTSTVERDYAQGWLLESLKSVYGGFKGWYWD